jgi:hypothetical protein
VLDHVMPRVPFGKGFFVTDPLHDIANQMDDPEPLAEAAENSGLAAGSGAANTGSVSSGPGGTGLGGASSTSCGCDNACIQSSIAVGIDAYLADTSLTIAEVEAIANEDVELALACCLCWTWYTPTTTTCTPGAWAVTGSGTHIENGVTVLRCTYSRPVTLVDTRTARRRHNNCTRTTTVQTRTRTGTQTTTVDTPYFSTLPPPCPTPAGGACNAVGPTTQTVPWGPPRPPC